MEQRHAEFFFQRANLLGNGRLGNVQDFGRAGKVQRFGHLQKAGKLEGIHGAPPPPPGNAQRLPAAD